MSDYSGKTNINVKEVYVVPITNEAEGTYGTALDFTGRARSFSYTPNVKKAKLYGDGEVQETVTDASTGSFSLALNYLTNADRQVIFSETAEKGSNVVTGDEQPVPCVVILKAPCKKDDSVVNLYKFFRVEFSPNEESVQQIEDGITYSTVQISGEYTKNKHNGLVMATRRHVVSATDATIIEGWYEMPEYTGPIQ